MTDTKQLRVKVYLQFLEEEGPNTWDPKFHEEVTSHGKILCLL